MQEPLAFDPLPFDEEEASVEKSLRPRRLAEFIGQKRVVENLRIAIEAAKVRGDVLDHLLFSGMPGLGKTTLSMLIAGEMGVDIRSTSGPAIERPGDLVGLLTQLQRGDVLFIDEIHRLPKEAEEHLYSAMEDFKVDILLNSGAEARSVRLSVAPFTLVGATTREGLLSAPFRSRFGITEKLDPYPPSDLHEIIRRSAAILECAITEAPALFLAERARGTPRYANRFLRRVRDLAQCQAVTRGEWKPGGERQILAIGLACVEECLDRLGIDANGLDRTDRRILELLLSCDDPVGVKTIAVSVGEEERTIEDVHEPYLIQRGMLVKTPRGRRPSSRAFQLYRPEGRLLI